MDTIRQSKLNVFLFLLLAMQTTILHAVAYEKTYTVKAGETLSDIARRYNLAIEDLAKKNHLQDANIIYPGQILQLSSAVHRVAATASEPSSDDSVVEQTHSGIKDKITKQPSKAKRLAQQSGQKRPEKQYQTTLLNRPLSIGGEIGTDVDYRKNVDLKDKSQDEEGFLAGDLELEFFLQWNEKISFLLEPKWSYERDLYVRKNDSGNDKKNSNSYFRRGQSWIYISDIADTDLAIQIGRQSFRDSREWWWDQDLDAIRFHFERKKISAEFGIAKELAKVDSDDNGIDPEQKDVVRLLGKLEWEWAKKQELAVFITHHDDQSGHFIEDQVIDKASEDNSDAKLTWLGLRASGRKKLKGARRFYYWADVARVNGDEQQIDFDNFGTDRRIVDSIGSFDVDGWAFDIGATYRSKLKGKPRFTLAYAKGSGDSNLADNKNTIFRQTGLHKNDGRFQSVNRFRYYGELLRPELSNLSISTIAIGLPLLQRSSMELVFHRYQQVDAVDSLRNDQLEDGPNGKNTFIGEEVDLIFGIEETTSWEWEFAASVFKAGDAFGKNDNELAYKVRLSLDYNF